MTNTYIGIDPGIANTGYACSKCKWTITGTSKPSTGVSLGGRIYEVTEPIREHIRLHKLDDNRPIIIIESTFGALVKNTTYEIGALLHEYKDYETHLVEPRWVVNYFGSKYKGKYKSLAMRQAKRQLGRNRQRLTQHEADAWCLIQHWLKYGATKKRGNK